MDINDEQLEQILNSPDSMEKLEQTIQEQLTPVKLNRKQRRNLAKKGGKQGRESFDAVAATAKKMAYIDLIKKLQKLNEKKENENERTDTSEEN